MEITGTDIPAFVSLRLQEEFAGVVRRAVVDDRRECRRVEGRFKHKWVDKWEYLMMLCRYIHLKPVKAKLVTRP